MLFCFFVSLQRCTKPFYVKIFLYVLILLSQHWKTFYMLVDKNDTTPVVAHSWSPPKRCDGSKMFCVFFLKGHLKTEILKNGYRGADSLKYNKITILGLKLRPHAVAVNGRAVRRDAFSYELNGVRAVLRNYEKS